MKKLLIFLALVICWNCSFSQTSPTNVNSSSPPSNTASSIGAKSGDYDVNLYTGRLSYNITLSTYHLANVDIPIGLSYNAGGIKVQDQPGISGTGWSLNAGGVISRYVQSLPDEYPDGYCGTNDRGSKVYGTLDTPYFNKIIDETYDAEPDRFVISFLNHTATFVLTKDGYPAFSSSSGLKVEYSPFNRVNGRATGGAEKWLIRDTEGNLFIFGDGAAELTNSTNHGRNNKDKSKSYISSWYLKKIVTADNQEINFTYNSVPAHNFTIYTNVHVPPLTATGDCSTPDFNGASWSENTDVNIPTPLYLKKISSSIFEINFNCDNNPYLNEITASQNGIVEHDFIFTYSSTTNGRPLLSSIEQKALNNARQYLYIFNYNKSENLPATNSIQTDFWGYYNANPGSSNIQGYLNGDKSSNFARTAANVLESVVNEYGGKTAFTYELNTYYDPDANLVKSSGGLRIKKITKYISETQQEETSYDYKNPSSGQSSSGQLYQNTNSYNLPVDIFTVILTNPATICMISAKYSYSECLSSIADLNGVQTGYSYVTVTNPDLSSTRFKFTNFSEYPDIADQKSFFNNTQNTVSGINFTAHFPLSSMSFARGKVLEEVQYGATHQAVKVIDYNYVISTPYGYVSGIKAYVQRYLNGKPAYYLNSRFNFATQDLLLSSKTETDNYYSFSGFTGSSSVTENYTYTTFQNNSYPVSRSRTLSNGNIEKTSYRYPFNVLSTIPSNLSYSSRPLSYMVQNNMNKPVEILNTIVRGSNEYVLSASLIRFSANGASVKPWITYRLKNNKSLLRSSYQNYTVVPGTSSETETFDQVNLEPVVQIMQYDDHGNPVAQKNLISNIYTSHLYGYDKNLEIAKVINARPDDFLYDGLEEPVTWVGALQDNTFRHSGQSSGKIVNTGSVAVSAKAIKTIQVGSFTTHVYKISGWVYSTQPAVNMLLELYKSSDTSVPSYTDAVSTTLTGKWVFLEKLIQVPQDVTGIYVKIYNNGAAGGGTVWFDDIRVHPADAQMTTSDYEPLVGKTGEGDVMGITMSYEYDPFRRLTLERDMNRNITKSYDFHRKVFKNAAVSQIFYKQGCPSNNAPSQVTYTVNSDLYSSTLSQEDADAKAMADIQQNGQTYADNNGTCTPVYIPYVTIVPTTSSSSNNQNYSSYEIRLFSDVNLTVPFVTSQRLTINYRVTTATSINNGTPTYSSQDYTTSLSSGSVKLLGQFENGCGPGGVINLAGDGTQQQSQNEQTKASGGSSTNLLPPGGGGNNTCITKTLILLPGTGYINAGGLIE